MKALTNVGSWPATCQFYAAGSPDRQSIPENPQLLAGGSAIIDGYETNPNFLHRFVSNKYSNPYTSFEQQNEGFDNSYPYYTSNDPTTVAVRVHCSDSPCPAVEGKTVHLPAHAAPQMTWFYGSSGDQHAVFLDTTSGSPVEYDFWGFPAPHSSTATSGPASGNAFVNGQLINVNSALQCDPINSDGWTTGLTNTQGNDTAGGNCSLGMIVRQSELAASRADNDYSGIGHALMMVAPCNSAGADRVPGVYPSLGTAAYACTNKDRNGVMRVYYGGPYLRLGMRLYWKQSCAQIAAEYAGQSISTKALLCALHRYGGYIMDWGGSELAIQGGAESATRYFSLGQRDVITSWLDSNGNHEGSCPTGARGSVVRSCLTVGLDTITPSEIRANLQIVDPCVTRRTC